MSLVPLMVQINGTRDTRGTFVYTNQRTNKPIFLPVDRPPRLRLRYRQYQHPDQRRGGRRRFRRGEGNGWRPRVWIRLLEELYETVYCYHQLLWSYQAGAEY